MKCFSIPFTPRPCHLTRSFSSFCLPQSRNQSRTRASPAARLEVLMSCAAPDPRPPFRSVQPSRVRSCLFLLLIHRFFFSRHHHPTWTPTRQSQPNVQPLPIHEIPTGQQEAPSIFWTSIASRTSPPTRSKLLHLCRRKVLSPIANPSSQPKPFQHVTRAVTTAYDSRV